MLPFKSREVNSSFFLFSKDAMMMSYVPRKNKSVILLSSQHNDQAVSTAEHAKPDIIFLWLPKARLKSLKGFSFFSKRM